MTTTYDTPWGAELGDALKVLADVATCCDELATASPAVIWARLGAIDAAYEDYKTYVDREFRRPKAGTAKQLPVGFTGQGTPPASKPAKHDA